MNTKILRTAAATLAIAWALTACNKAPEAPAVTDPAAQPAPADAAPAPVAEPTPAPEPAAKPKPKPKPKPRPAAEPVSEAEPAPAVCYDCGTIANINEVRQQGSGSGAGAVMGGIAGGVAGHQFGKGKGKDAATVLGALAGAFGGNMAEKQIRATTTYDVTISMESGGSRTINVPELGGLSVGEHVRVNGNTISPR
jgi:outer membrane lipoprotein SlyB